MAPSARTWDELDAPLRAQLERRVLDAVSDYFASGDDALRRLSAASAAETEELAHTFWDLGLADTPAELRGTSRLLRANVRAHLHALYWRAFGEGVRAGGGPWDPEPVSLALARDALPHELERAELEDVLERDGRVKALQWLAARRGLSIAEARALWPSLIFDQRG